MLEDDGDVCRAVDAELQANGFGVDTAESIVEAEVLLAANRYDALVLDRTVPGGDALDHLGAWRARGLLAPALFLTAHDSVDDRVAGFEVGGDDYLGKPFALAELVARVRRLCRQQTLVLPPIVRLGDLEVDLARRSVTRAGVLLTLTAKELAVLELLVGRADTVVAKEDLMEQCWDERTDPRSNTIEVHIASLRRKLGDPPLIRTVRGSGYIVETPGRQP